MSASTSWLTLIGSVEPVALRRPSLTSVDANFHQGLTAGSSKFSSGHRDAARVAALIETEVTGFDGVPGMSPGGRHCPVAGLCCQELVIGRARDGIRPLVVAQLRQRAGVTTGRCGGKEPSRLSYWRCGVGGVMATSNATQQLAGPSGSGSPQ